MTLFEVDELMRYWLDSPPLHLLAASWFGLSGMRGRQRSAPARGNAKAERDELLIRLGPGFARGEAHDRLPPATFDLGELRRRANR